MQRDASRESSQENEITSTTKWITVVGRTTILRVQSVVGNISQVGAPMKDIQPDKEKGR